MTASRNCRLLICILSGIVLLPFVLAAQNTKIPWKNAKDATNYVLIGQDLWNAETGQLFGKGWAEHCSLPYNPQLVKNAPTLIFCPGKPPQSGFAMTWARLGEPYSKSKINLKYGSPWR